MKYEQIIHPCAYAPWREDFEFLDTYHQIAKSTLVDIYRCYELWSLIEQTRKLDKGALIEIGVWRGGTGALIAKKALSCCIDENVYLCDTFKGVVKAGTNDPCYENGEHNDTSLEMVEILIQKLQLTNAKLITGIFPEESAHLIEAQFFRFCHIDVDVYESAKGCLEWVWDKLVVGGIVVFDDYGFSRCGGVTQYVNELKESWDLHFIHNLNGHALFIKLGRCDV